MNTSQNFVISALDSFISLFPYVRVRYEYDKEALVHTIEVVPNKIFRHNDKYIKWESEMFDEFVARYPQENICFISDDALFGIQEEMYIKEGLFFAPFTTADRCIFFVKSDYIAIHQGVSLSQGEITKTNCTNPASMNTEFSPNSYSTAPTSSNFILAA